MKVKATRAFNDLQDDCVREVGDIWEVSNERFLALNSTEFGELVVEVKKTPKNGVKNA